MSRPHRAVEPSGATILLVDDSHEYVAATARLLAGEGHEVLRAYDGAEALEVLRERRVNLLLLDYFMPGLTAAETVAGLRGFDPLVQVILQTGYAGEYPPRTLLRSLDIQGYFDKSDGPELLLLWVDVGLKAARTVQALERRRRGLRDVLEATPALHRIQPVAELRVAILDGAAALAEARAGALALFEDDGELAIAARRGEPGTGAVGAGVTVPLRVGDATLGTLWLNRVADGAREPLDVYANQAAAALQSARLYELATLDPLTGTYTRRFFDQLLRRELAAAARGGTSTALLVVDLDRFKQINDGAGHLVGDAALAATGAVLRAALRVADLAGRFGGDEFAVLLPKTGLDGAGQVAARVLEQLAAVRLRAPDGGEVRVAASLGIAELSPPRDDGGGRGGDPRASLDAAGTALFARTDEALYGAKRAGGGRVEVGGVVAWPG